MKIKPVLHWLSLILWLALAGNPTTSALAGVDTAKDTLADSAVATPCTLHAESHEVALDFQRVIDRFLLRYGMTPAREFALTLEGCDNRVLTGAAMRVTGRESTELPGLLALDGTTTARGVVVALHATQGATLPVNAVKGQPLEVTDNMAITMQAHLEVEPSAQRSRQVVLERFRATLFVAVDYY